MHFHKSSTVTPPKRRFQHRSLGAALVTAGIVAGIVAMPAPAMAYGLTGCHWDNGNLRVSVRTISGVYLTALNQASSNYTANTDVNLTNTTDGGPAFGTLVSNYGATSYEGLSQWRCTGGRTTSNVSMLNTYYLSSSTPVARLKVVWLHEVGHGLGLADVKTRAVVMYQSASDAYGDGVRSLTIDEVQGINSLY